MNDQASIVRMNSDPNLNLCSNVHANFFSDFQEEFEINCDYHSEISSITELKSLDQDNFTTMSLNCQSFLSKKSEIINIIDNYKANGIIFSCICLQETWFSNLTDLDNIPIDNYKWYVRSRVGRGGGVATLVLNHMTCEEIFSDLFRENIFESLVTKINYGDFNCVVVNLYRPPKDINNLNIDTIEKSNTILQFLDTLSELLNRLETFSCPIFFCGDHNLNLFSCTINNSNSNSFLENLIFSGFLNLTYKATRITQNSHTLIDIMAVKNCLNNIRANHIVVTDISDHFVLVNSFCTNKLLKKPKKSPFFTKRLMKDENINNFREALRLNNWDEVHSQVDVNNAISLFIEKFMELYNIHCPLKTFHFNNRFMPQQSHMNSFLLKCRLHKQTLFRLKNSERTEENECIYRSYRNQYNRAVRNAKKKDYQDKIRAAGKDGKKIWRTIKDLIGMKKETNQIEFIEVDNRKVHGSMNIANEFNKYLSSLGEQLTPLLPTTDKSFRDFLPPPSNNSIFIEPLYPVKVYNLIKCIKPKPSRDIDDFSMQLLSLVAEGICAPLSSIYNLSLTTGVYPDRFKISKTIIIHKSGSLSTMDCYRGVSLIPALSKPLERYIYDSIYDFLDNQSYFSDRQFGFRRKFSTFHNVLDLYNLVTETLSSGRSCLSIFVDVRKCFDMVDREILLAKLSNAGIRGPLLSWFRSYYSGRFQKVFLGGEFSSSMEEIVIGILQGSILGVVCFLIFVNDIVLAVPPAVADDAQLFLSVNNLDSLMRMYS